MFSTNLIHDRKEKHLTQSEVGDFLSYGVSTICNYERGKNQPSIDDLIKLADSFCVYIDFLVGRKNREEEFISNRLNDIIKEFRILFHSLPFEQKSVENFEYEQEFIPKQLNFMLRELLYLLDNLSLEQKKFL